MCPRRPRLGVLLQWAVLDDNARARPARLPAGFSSKRALLAACMCGSFLGSLQLSAVAQESESWSSIQGDPAHTGAIVDPRLEPPLRRLWRVALAGDSPLSGAPVAGGLAVATSPSKVVAFDPASGEILWMADRARGPVDPPALDESTGSEGVVVFTEGSQPENSAIVALEISDQTRRWRVELPRPARGAPVIAEGSVFVGTQAGSVEAIDLASGKVDWTFQAAAGRIDTPPAVAGGLVYAVSEDLAAGTARLSAIDVSTGEETWGITRQGVSVRVSAPLVGEGRVFVGFGDAFVRAFDAETGGLEWEQPVRSFFSPLSVPAYAGGDVYLADRSGTLYRLDGATGEAIWDFQFPSPVIRGSPLVVGRAVYIGLDDGTLAAVRTSSGVLVWQTRLPSGPVGSLSPADGLLLAPAVGARGGLVAFERDPGGTLLTEESPTRLDLLAALLNFGGGFLIVSIGLIGFYRLLDAIRGRRGVASAAESRT